MRIIGIHGLAGSGKNLVASLAFGRLVELGFVVVGDCLAMPFKREAWRQGGWRGEKDTFWRTWLQDTGQAGRDETPDKWINYLSFRLGEAGGCSAFSVCLVPDIRYENEAAWVRGVGGVVWHVTGRGGLEGHTGEHPSEGGIEKAFDDVVIENDGDLPRLIGQVMQATDAQAEVWFG